VSGGNVSGRDDQPRLKLLIATDAGYFPTVRLATKLHRADDLPPWPLLVLFGADDTFPFRPRPSTILVPGMPVGVIACVPALEEFGVASRLASTAGLPGCHDGEVTELAALWLQSLEPGMLAQVHIVVSGAEQTVSAVEALAKRVGVSFQVMPTQAVEG
jgi:dihydroorotate dehydrogenase electron transfer subunit